MARRVEYSVGIGAFHDLAKIHHRDASADISHDVQVVGDEDVGQAEALTQLDEKIEDLRLHGSVKGGDRLVGNDNGRLDSERPRDGYALALPTAEGVRQPVLIAGGQARP